MKMISLGLSANDKYSKSGYVSDELWQFEIDESAFWGVLDEMERDLEAAFFSREQSW